MAVWVAVASQATNHKLNGDRQLSIDVSMLVVPDLYSLYDTSDLNKVQELLPYLIIKQVCS